MPRLVTFGCSNTYGQALVDCYGPGGRNGPYPSKFAWPQLLADKLGYECRNASIPGGSHKIIRWRIQNFDFQPDDLVVVLWTNPDRHCIIPNNNKPMEDIPSKPWPKIASIGSWMVPSHKYYDSGTTHQWTKKATAYYKHIHDNFDALADYYTTMNYAKFYMDSMGVSNHHMLIHWHWWHDGIFEWNKVKPITKECIHDLDHPRAQDGRHPGAGAHKEMAEILYEIFKKDLTN